MRGEHIPEKRPLPVEIGFAGGTLLKGRLWIATGRSLGEVLAGSTAFLEFTPFGEGRVRYLGKTHIQSISELDIPKPVQLYDRRKGEESDDPHQILGVAPGVPWHAIREAYLRLAKTYHPDRVAGANLPAEVTDYMNRQARRINAAYAMLESTVRSAAAGEPNTTAV